VTDSTNASSRATRPPADAVAPRSLRPSSRSDSPRHRARPASASWRRGDHPDHPHRGSDHLELARVRRPWCRPDQEHHGRDVERKLLAIHGRRIARLATRAARTPRAALEQLGGRVIGVEREHGDIPGFAATGSAVCTSLTANSAAAFTPASVVRSARPRALARKRGSRRPRSSPRMRPSRAIIAPAPAGPSRPADRARAADRSPGRSGSSRAAPRAGPRRIYAGRRAAGR
jgi:hypothetical protein